MSKERIRNVDCILEKFKRDEILKMYMPLKLWIFHIEKLITHQSREEAHICDK